ncbi:recombinase family protein [Acidiferrimicrobium sp. IK]|nr:recombinase family protein [Acidiferrimicrobium sp. IK]MCU4187524.1 recombinase family protein [Acidiferrimicrobium sp. IK]
MSAETVTKVKATHLQRAAYLYVRQSTLRQVLNNTESTLRQYDLRRRAVALGWTAEQIIVVDVDQGHSGASAADREGFQRLVADVSMGRAGIVLGLECSRLGARCSEPGTLRSPLVVLLEGEPGGAPRISSQLVRALSPPFWSMVCPVTRSGRVAFISY